ncbi:respiratory chain complex I subunit 1 family protein [Thermococcus aciditolerans]|uniref:Hydrogenase n=1 Tax=Thermococcus aciditolerans TaxID=2598455 RepID=A0A5C0SMB2_9EURY|nr:NADH-quinone oxidoreductase subunit H [Thermococcus aciditolerans]QEK14298.1 hydrogenase [Thermococcus aciditolerans]
MNAQDAAPIIVPLMVPFIDGVARKVRAVIQKRVGPSIVQSWYDLLSFLRIECNSPVDSLTFRLAPYIAFVSAIGMLLFLPFGEKAPFGFEGDVIAFIYVFTMFSAAVVMGALSVPSSYTSAGAGREVTMSIVFKPLFAVVIGIFAMKTGALTIEGMASALKPSISVLGAYLLLIYLTYVEAGFVPYDIAEAETELLGGPLAEYSGRLFAIMLWAFQIKRFAMIWLLASMLVLPFVSGSTVLLFQCGAFALLFLGMVVYEAMSARYRIDQAVRNGTMALTLGIFFLLVGWMGW